MNIITRSITWILTGGVLIVGFAKAPAQSASMTNWAIPAIIIKFTDTPGIDHILQSSSDFTNWQDMAAIPANVDGSYTYTNFPTTSPLFYRTASIIPTTAKIWNGSVTTRPSYINGQLIEDIIYFNFMLMAPTNSPVYVGTLPTIATFTVSPGGRFGDVNLQVYSTTNDTGSYYLVPAGTSRGFAVAGTLSDGLGIGGPRFVSVTSFACGTSPTNLTALTLTNGLQALAIRVDF